MDRTELAWAAGFFDAEGWAAAVKSRRGTRPFAQINQADAFGVPEVLTRFQAAVGAGRIGGPRRVAGKRDLYHWVASSRGDVRGTFEALSTWLGAVKTLQFGSAIGPVTPTTETPSRDELLAWAAGLFDGDGSTYVAKHRTHSGYRTAEIAITQSSPAGAPEVLITFRAAMANIGHIGGPYGGDETHEPVYRLKVYRLRDVEAVIRSLWPWLGSVKRVQAAIVIAGVASQPALPRGNPAWGVHKSHCVHGHEYATARIRPYRSRAAGTTERRPSKQCLTCVRETARRRYAEMKARRPT